MAFPAAARAASPEPAPSPGPSAETEIPPQIPSAELACSFRHPACVHAAPANAPTALAVLEALDRTWDVATNVLGLPSPLFDETTGHYDVYLAPEMSRTAVRDRDQLSSFDRATAFSVVDARLPPGRTLDLDVARELFTAIALGVAPATDRGSLRGEASYLAALTSGADWIDGVDVAQAHPDRAVMDAYPEANTEAATSWAAGSALFYGWLDDAFAMSPGRVIQALWALAPTRTPGGSPHFYAEPDGFDVLRASLKDLLGAGTNEDDVFETFAVDRASFRPPPRLEWDIAWPVKARTLASPQGIAPTGAAYVRVATRGKKPGARLRVDLQWEEHARMRWDVVQLDATGHEIARLPIKAADKATEAHLQVVDLDSTDALIVAGTNLGDWAVELDPDDEATEPHGWLCTVAAE